MRSLYKKEEMDLSPYIGYVTVLAQLLLMFLFLIGLAYCMPPVELYSMGVL